MGRSAIREQSESRPIALYDVTQSVKIWGRRGVTIGAIFGFALGVGIVAIPFTSDVLTFGVLGTLIVAAVEGGVIAGAFAVCIAALYSKGTLKNADTFARRWPSRGIHHQNVVAQDLPPIEPLPEFAKTYV